MVSGKMDSAGGRGLHLNSVQETQKECGAASQSIYGTDL